MSQPDLLPGLLVDEKYEIVRPLGAGGMGIVYEARHRQLGRNVAIKFLSIDDEGLAKRFAREARHAAQLLSDHVAKVVDFSYGGEGSKPYLVLELLEGEDLRHVVRRNGPLPVDIAVDYVLQALLAFAEAHSHDIIHRDIKPANLFLARTAAGGTTIKVMDFGISKSRSATIHEADLTGVATMLGTVAYAPPEILSDARSADARADIWSLGVTLFHLVTARHPFEAETTAAVITGILQRPPTSPLAFRPELPPPFVEAVLRCLERNVDHRYGNVAELAAALAPFGSANAKELAQQVAHVLDVPVLSARDFVSPMAVGGVRDTVKMDSPISESSLPTRPGTSSRADPREVEEDATPKLEVARSEDFETPQPTRRPDSRRNIVLAVAVGAIAGLIGAALYGAGVASRSDSIPSASASSSSEAGSAAHSASR